MLCPRILIGKECRPIIVDSKPNLVNPICSINPLDDVLLWAGLKYPQRYGTTLKVTQF